MQLSASLSRARLSLGLRWRPRNENAEAMRASQALTKSLGEMFARRICSLEFWMSWFKQGSPSSLLSTGERDGKICTQGQSQKVRQITMVNSWCGVLHFPPLKLGITARVQKDSKFLEYNMLVWRHRNIFFLVWMRSAVCTTIQSVLAGVHHHLLEECT